MAWVHNAFRDRYYLSLIACNPLVPMVIGFFAFVTRFNGMRWIRSRAYLYRSSKANIVK